MILSKNIGSNKHVLQRSTFKTSRLLDFASEKELVAQTGHQRDAWPMVVVKELVDNALDACEEAGIAPVVTVTVDDDGITVTDNGPGLPASTIRDVLDFQVRTSSREAYISPTRGAQGNALKTIVAMPFVLDGMQGRVEIEAQNTLHDIDFTVDRIRQEPVIAHNEQAAQTRNGTSIRVRWPVSPRSNLHEAKVRFLQVAEEYAWLNPHLTIGLNWFGNRISITSTNPSWAKWKPTDPTSPHWYNPERLERLIAAYIANEATRARTIREFVSEFRGLSGTAKQKAVLKATGLSREPLTALVSGNGFDVDLVGRLLAAMKGHSSPVNPALLGSIGRDHFASQFEANGCEMDSFDYRRVMGVTDGVPWIVEIAFGWCPSADERRLITGVNWSPGIVNPFRELGSFGASLDTILSQQRVDHEEPVILALHMSCALVEYTDRGKSAVVIRSDQSAAIINCVQSVTTKWAKQRKQEERTTSATLNRRQAMIRSNHVSIKEAAWQVMDAAYLKASANGTLPAHARQIMYAARGYIQRTADRELGKGFDKYFTQTLLPDYIEEQGVVWNVVYDARGHFIEPHTKEQVPLGTLQVRNYLRRIDQHQVDELDFTISERHYPTIGPKHRYSAILFIEKEGFMPLFEAVKLAQRYDIAIMSTKGMSVTASRELLDSVCKNHGVPLLVLHDFDRSGFSILGTLHLDTRRYQYNNRIRVIDLGIRLEDIDGLEAERVLPDENGQIRLGENGATADEIAFLQHSRVELNAFASDKFIAWIEGKLEKHGIQKVVPDDDTLADAYSRMRRQAEVQAVIDRAMEGFEDEVHDIPQNLGERIKAKQDMDRTLPWDEVLQQIACEDHEADHE
jgi:DNA topoisomerase VI subunit B